MTTTARLLPSSASGHVRPFDLGRDLNPVADLIERCFADTLDLEGQRYLRQMRSAAHNPRFMRWATTVTEFVSLPLSGYVWEEDGLIVGNLSLIPFNTQGKRIYLIANVAVHPDYRRRGIARALTLRALEYAEKRRKIDAVWLQVRADNKAALGLYSSLAFSERARRTTWHVRWDPHSAPDMTGVSARPRRAQDWSTQLTWLERLYPKSLSWNLTINLAAFRPGLWSTLYNLLSGSRLRHFVAVKGERTVGVLSWQRMHFQADRLWLAAPPDREDLAVGALLCQARTFLPPNRMMTLDFPAEGGAETLKTAGFFPVQTLIWMERKL